MKTSFNLSLVNSSLKRSFATATGGGETGKIASVHVPLTLYSLEGKYATALYTSSVKSNCLETTVSQVKKLQAVLNSNETFRNFLKNPTIGVESKRAIVSDMLTREKYHPIMVRFFETMAGTQRLPETIKILKAFEEIMKAHEGQTEVTITSSAALDAKYLNDLKEVIRKNFVEKKDGEIKFFNRVDPAILGGIIVQVGDKTVDLSVSSKLNKIQTSLDQGI